MSEAEEDSGPRGEVEAIEQYLIEEAWGTAPQCGSDDDTILGWARRSAKDIARLRLDALLESEGELGVGLQADGTECAIHVSGFRYRIVLDNEEWHEEAALDYATDIMDWLEGGGGSNE
tara:strand:- start:1289 stop:1645 length:357 start_codon:yes stop_codon:yes gene_type:complete